MEKKALIGAGLATVLATAAWASGSTEETRDVKSFDEVSLYGSMNVDITVGEKQSVRVVADDKIIDDIETFVRGDTLRIKLKDGHYGRIKKMHVYVTVPKLEGASIHGSGDMDITGGIDGNFYFSVYGSGNAEIDDLKVSDLELSIHGSGNVKLNGSCDELDADVHGSGDVYGKALKCGDVEVDIHGSGDVEIGVTNSINAAVFGSGDVEIYGKPDKVRSKVRGSSDINVH